MITQSRIDFERWASSMGQDTRRWFDSYYNRDTQFLWVGWIARDNQILELSAKLAADKGE